MDSLSGSSVTNNDENSDALTLAMKINVYYDSDGSTVIWTIVTVAMLPQKRG